MKRIIYWGWASIYILCMSLEGCTSKKTSEHSNHDVMESEIYANDSTRQTVATTENGVFKGTWSYRECLIKDENDQYGEPYQIFFNIDLYAKTVEHGGEKTHGGFYVNNGYHEGGGDITSVCINGNEAQIEYTDPAGLVYSATLIYIPETKQLEFIDGEVVGKPVDDKDINSLLQFHRAIPKQKILEAVCEGEPHPMSARKGLGLYGNVKTLTDEENCVIQFDKIGNILSISFNNQQAQIYYYNTLCTEYTIDGWGPYCITYDEHKRSELSKDESDTDGSVTYLFDNQNRVIECSRVQRMSLVTSTFTYSGSNKLPDNKIISDYDETGSYKLIDTYDYVEVDEQGNWLKRKVTRTLEATIEEKTTVRTEPVRIETRAIEYF